MHAAVQNLVHLVEFLGNALGRNTEIVLHDFEDFDHSIVAIANGHISGRRLGGPPTDFALRVLQDPHLRSLGMITGYLSHSADNRKLRSASYLVREDGLVVGMMCINIDVSAIEQLDALQQSLLEGFAPALNPASVESASAERLNLSTGDLIHGVLAQHEAQLGKSVPHFSQEERIDVVRQLSDEGAFLLKGAVSEVAQALDVSEPSVYRYLQKIKKD